jgi:predicted DNA-binding transcriptional regulator AlpA
LTATAATGPADLLKDLTDPLLSKRQLMAAFGISAKTVNNWSRRHGFPRPVRLTARCYRWSRPAVLAWLGTREGAAANGEKRPP